MVENFGVLIVGFKRFSNILRLVNKLIEYDVTQIFVSIDRATGDEEVLDQKNFLNQLQEIELREKSKIYIRYQTKNLGAAVSVITSIDWISESCTAFAILEDDLVISGNFIKYVKTSIDHFDDDDRVLLFSGNNYFGSDSTDLKFSRIPLTWGWATTRRKWEIIQSNIFMKNLRFAFKFNSVIDFLLSQFLLAGKHRALKGIIDAWDLPLACYMFQNNKLCLVPPKNLVKNIGYDDFALNTKEKNKFHDFPIDENWEITEWPLSVKPSKHLEKMIATDIYQIRNQNALSGIFQPLIDKIRKTVPKYRNPLPTRVHDYSTPSTYGD